MFLPPENDSCSSRSDNLGSLLNSGTCCCRRLSWGRILRAKRVRAPARSCFQTRFPRTSAVLLGFLLCSGRFCSRTSSLFLPDYFKERLHGILFSLNKMQRAVSKDRLFSVKDMILERKMLFLDFKKGESHPNCFGKLIEAVAALSDVTQTILGRSSCLWPRSCAYGPAVPGCSRLST